MTNVFDFSKFDYRPVFCRTKQEGKACIQNHYKLLLMLNRMLISNLSISPRDDYYDNGSWTGGARWAFFAIFVILIIIVVLGTLRINKSRTQHGQQPIYGTRWMTPPSYYQSQNQYNQPTRREADMPSAYVPTYTEQAGDYDMGFYDSNGVFHPNPNSKAPHPPEPVHHRTAHSQDGVPVSESIGRDQTVHSLLTNDDIGDIFRPPAGPPPTQRREEDTIRG